ncbi:MAG: GAF domain-containing SpoIIE family protein phosphatase [Rhodothermales bacterium]|nr:GAF domain-containing SpoIIE family protein phosphatase [Rhodothermales bacterium]
MAFQSQTASASGRSVEQLEDEVRRLQSAVQELAVLNDIAVSASKSTDVNDVLEVIVNKSIKAVRAEQGSIMLVTEQQDAPLKTLIRQEDRTTGSVPYKVGINITGWVLQNQQLLVVDDLSTDSRFPGIGASTGGIQSVVAVPIRHRAKMIGILLAVNKKSGEGFSEGDQRLLGIISSQSGQLIQNMQLQEEAREKARMEQELSLARNIQTRLLPTSEPIRDRLQVASYFEAADEVSGDYYDYFELPDSKLGAIMADVSGHGASSALVMTMLKGVLQSTILRYESPGQVITELNAILSRLLPAEMFVTMVFLEFDGAARKLRYANAGHNPLVWYRAASGQTVGERQPGPAVGILGTAQYKIKELDLEPGDVIVTYTDGLTEAFSREREMFGDDRLVEAVSSHSGESAADIVGGIVDQVNDFTKDYPQSDDIAIIAIRVGS